MIDNTNKISRHNEEEMQPLIEEFKNRSESCDNAHRFLDSIFDKYGIERSKFLQKTGLDVGAFYKLKKANLQHTLKTLVTFVIAFKMSQTDAESLLRHSGYVLSDDFNYQSAYRVIIQNSQLFDVDTANTFLEKVGIEQKHFLKTNK